MRISTKQDMVSGMGFIGDSDGVYKMGPNTKTVAVSGTPPLVLENGKNKPLKSLRLYGKSTQETTTGAQLFNVNGEIGMMRTGDANNASINTVDGNVVTVNQNAQTGGACGQKISVKQNTTYTFSCDILSFGTGTRLYMAVNNQELNYYIKGFNNLEHAEITIDSGDNTELVFGFASYEGIGTQVTNVMLNTGSTALPWEPYTGGQAAPNLDYPQEIVNTGMKWSTGKNVLDVLKCSGYNTVNNGDGTLFIQPDNKSVASLIGAANKIFDDSVEICAEHILSLKSNNALQFDIFYSNGDGTKYPLNKPFVVTEKILAGNIYLYGAKEGSTVSELMLRKADATEEYEPYTRGVPKPYGDAVSVVARGKNLLDANLLNDINNFDRSYSSSGYAFFDVQVKSDIDITVSIGQTYRSGGCYLKVMTENDTWVGGIWMCHGTVELTDKVTIAASQNKGHVYLFFSETITKIRKVLGNIGYIQVEYGDTATAYEPYYEPQSLSIPTLNGLPGLPVNAGGNYIDEAGQQWIADCIDFKRGKYVQNIDKYIFEGTEYYDIPKPNPSYIEGTSTDAYCEIKTMLRSSSTLNNCLVVKKAIWSIPGAVGYCSNGKQIHMRFPNEVLGVADDAILSEKKAAYIAYVKKRYEEGNPIIVYFQLEEPVERDLSAEEIAAYKSLKTYKGTTVIESDCYMDIKYNT